MSEYWLGTDQFEVLRPLLPDKVRGVPRVDDRRVISGIIHLLKSGGRWVDAPPCYGPRKTLYIPRRHRHLVLMSPEPKLLMGESTATEIAGPCGL